jgi:hypothetical protein
MATTLPLSEAATRLVQAVRELNKLTTLATPFGSWSTMVWSLTETGYTLDLRQLPDKLADDPKNQARALLLEVLDSISDYSVLR